MSIVSANEMTDARTARYDDTGHREYTRTFIVITDNSANDAAYIVLSPLFPRLYTPYIVPAGIDAGAVLKSKQATPDPETPYKWIVTLTYSTRTGNASRHPGNPDPSDPSGFSNSPLDRPTLITWDAVQFTRPVVKTIDSGLPIANSAGDEYDPKVEIDDSRPVLIIERPQASFSQSTAIAYRDAINSDSFFGFDPNTVKVAKITATLEYEKSIYFWKARYEFHVRPETWTLSLLDRGYRQLKTGDATKAIVILDDSGNPVSQPVNLDGLGHVLPANGTPVFRQFNVYKALPFAALGLP